MTTGRLRRYTADVFDGTSKSYDVEILAHSWRDAWDEAKERWGDRCNRVYAAAVCEHIAPRDDCPGCIARGVVPPPAPAGFHENDMGRALKNYADSDPRPMTMGEKEAFRVGYRVAEARWLGVLRAKMETLEKWQAVVEAAIADITDTPRPGTRTQAAVDALSAEHRPSEAK